MIKQASVMDESKKLKDTKKQDDSKPNESKSQNDNKSKDEAFRERKRNYMAEYNKQYYAKNRERIRQMMKEKIYCEVCKKQVARHNYSRHKTTERHKQKARKMDRLQDKVNQEVKKKLQEILDSL